MKTVYYLSGDPFQYGGGATVSINVLENMLVDPKPVLVVSHYAEIPRSISNNFTVRRFWMPRNRMLQELFDQLIAPLLLLTLSADRVVCVNSIVPLLYPKRVDLFFQMRMFYFEELDSFSKKIKNCLGRMSAKKSANLYCASQDHANDMIKNLSLNPNKVKVIHLGFNSNVSMSDEFSIYRDESLLFVSVIRPYKNLDGLVEAVIKAKQQRPDLPISLDVVGEPADYPGIDAYMTKIKKRIEDSGFSDSFNFLGKLAHGSVIDKLVACKALVFPTLFEGFGLPLIEAMGTKTPVICSSVNSLPEIGGDTVVYFDINSESSLCERIIELYSHGYSTEMLNSAYLRSRCFNWKETAYAISENTEFKVI